MNKDEMKEKIKALQAEIAALETAIEDFDSLLANNVYLDHRTAERAIHGRYESIASEACEGSYNYGDDEYEQKYQVEGDPATYMATVTFQYNRHDKQYYYIDGSDYSYKLVEPA